MGTAPRDLEAYRKHLRAQGFSPTKRMLGGREAQDKTADQAEALAAFLIAAAALVRAAA